WLAGGYVGLASPRAGEVVVALAAKRSGASRAGQVDETGRQGYCPRSEAPQNAFERLRVLNPDANLWTVLPADGPQRYQAHGSAGFPWKPPVLGRGNVLLVGDAAGYEEPY